MLQVMQCCSRKVKKRHEEFGRNLSGPTYEGAVAMAISNALKAQLIRPNRGE